MVSGQVITVGMGNVVDINFQSIEIAMNRMRIENKDECFLKVIEIAHYMIEKSKESKANGH